MQVLELLKLLVPKLVEDGHKVNQTPADADRMIVSTALAIAFMGETVTVYANDTDVIIMLLHHWNQRMASVDKVTHQV